MISFRFLASMLLCLLLGAPAAADTVAEQVTGVIIDPLKLGGGSSNALKAARELSASLDRTMASLHALWEANDKAVRGYLDQVDDIVAKTRDVLEQESGEWQRLVLELAQQANALERRVHLHAKDIIWRAQCAVEVSATDTLQRAMKQALDQLIEADPTIKILGIPVGSIQLNSPQMQYPDRIYWAIRENLIKELDELQPSSHPRYVLSTYMNLARLARHTQCHFIDNAGEAIYIQEYHHFNRLLRPWLSTLNVKYM